MNHCYNLLEIVKKMLNEVPLPNEDTTYYSRSNSK